MCAILCRMWGVILHASVLATEMAVERMTQAGRGESLAHAVISCELDVCPAKVELRQYHEAAESLVLWLISHPAKESIQKFPCRSPGLSHPPQFADWTVPKLSRVPH